MWYRFTFILIYWTTGVPSTFLGDKWNNIIPPSLLWWSLLFSWTLHAVEGTPWVCVYRVKLKTNTTLLTNDTYRNTILTVLWASVSWLLLNTGSDIWTYLDSYFHQRTIYTGDSCKLDHEANKGNQRTLLFSTGWLQERIRARSHNQTEVKWGSHGKLP